MVGRRDDPGKGGPHRSAVDLRQDRIERRALPSRATRTGIFVLTVPLPMSLYTDRGSHYFHSARTGEIDRAHPTQVGRALAQLEVEHIGAFSPHSPSRDGRSSERPRRAGARSGRSGRCRIVWSRSSSSPGSRRSRRPTPCARSICRSTTPVSPSIRPAKARPSPPILGVDRDEILCVEEERQVGNDNCVSYRTLNPRTAIRGPMRPRFVKARVKPRVYPDGSHALFHGPRCIGRYDEKGRLKDNGPVQRAA